MYLAQDIVRLHSEGELPKFEAQDLPLDRPVGTISINPAKNGPLLTPSPDIKAAVSKLQLWSHRFLWEQLVSIVMA